MAEVVQLHLEDLLDGFKCLEDEGVFSVDEIQQIIKNIENHEYKLQRSVKEKEINLKYINYLQCLLQLIEKKYDKMGINSNEDVKHMFIKKIKTEFRKLRDRYQRDVKIWLSFINFCKRNKHKDYVSKLYNRMLQVLPDKPQLWISSAKWFLEEQNSWDLARNSFKSGLRFNSKSPELYLEFFRFELLYIETIIKRKKFLSEEQTIKKDDNDEQQSNALYEYLPESHIDNDNILNGKVAMTIFKKSIEEIGLKYVNEFLEILDDFIDQYSFARELKNEILDFMKDNYGQSEETWNLLAKLKYSLDSDLNKKKKFKLIDQEYQIALDKFNNEKMWKLYLDNLLVNLKLNLNTNDEQEYYNKFKDELMNCFKFNLMNRLNFIEIIDCLNKLNCSTQYFQSIVKLGLEKWDYDINIWYLYIKSLIKDNGTKIEIKNLFNRVIKIISSNQLDDKSRQIFYDFIKIFIQWAIDNLNERELIKILETNSITNVAIKELNLSRFIASYCKPILLEETSKFNDGINKCRQLYDKYKLMNPIVKEFFLKMIELELNNLKLNHNLQNIKFIRKIYNEMLIQFGKDDHKLWLDFCEFELNFGSYTEIARIYEIAKKQLNPDESDLFIQNYSILNKKFK